MIGIKNRSRYQAFSTNGTEPLVGEIHGIYQTRTAYRSVTKFNRDFNEVSHCLRSSNQSACSRPTDSAITEIDIANYR